MMDDITPNQPVWWVMYLAGFRFLRVLLFIGGWVWCISRYGFLLGVGLGWLPSLMAASVIAFLWPIALIAALAIVGVAWYTIHHPSGDELAGAGMLVLLVGGVLWNLFDEIRFRNWKRKMQTSWEENRRRRAFVDGDGDFIWDEKEHRMVWFEEKKDGANSEEAKHAPK